jgi:SH3 domain-containing YSC84-like protein 1
MSRHRVILSVCLVLVAAPALADDKAKAHAVVEKMTESFHHLRDDPNMGWFRDHLKQAQAVMVLRQFRAGFILGGAGGSGVMLSRNARGQWSYPAFMAWALAVLASRLGLKHPRSPS